MTPLGMMVAGLGLVVVDFRFDGFDMIPDLVGWVVVLAGLAQLVSRSPWFTAAAIAASCGIALGIPLLLGEPGPLLNAVEAVVLAVVVFGTCTGIREVVATDRTRGHADLIRWTGLGLSLVALLTTLVADGPTVVTGPAAFGVVVAALAALAFLVSFLVFLWTNREDPALGGSSPVSGPDPLL